MRTSARVKTMGFLGGVLGCIVGFAQAAPGTNYRYRLTNEGIEIENGLGRFNRPLYSSVNRPLLGITLMQPKEKE